MKNNRDQTSFLIPNWPAPDTVNAVITLRGSGISKAPFNSFNLADHVGDDPTAVSANRQQLIESLGLLSQPIWLNQVHGTEIVYGPEAHNQPDADASYTDTIEQACVVLTADCLPVLFCNQQGTQVAAAHAGWRGLCAGILRKTIACFSPEDTVLAYLGPAIGPQVFEVGEEVYEAFASGAKNSQHRTLIKSAFEPSGENHYLADLYALARAELRLCGVEHIYGGQNCTFSQSDHFYSYRRDQITGRNASLIWLKA
jgi:YfiH family protein